MKKLFIVFASVAAFLFIVSTLVDMGKTVEVGGMYRGEGQIVTVEYVGRGDSVLARYPGQFTLSENSLPDRYVVFTVSGGKFYMMELMFKQKYDRVHSTPPDTRQPSPRE